MLRNYDMESYLLKNKTLIYAFLAAILSYGFVYGFEITHFTLSIDEEPMDNFAQTLSAGRWGHALLRHYILPEPYLPFFTLCLSLIFLSLSAALSSLYLKLDRMQSITFCVMLAALPQLAYQLQFSNQADTVAISMLCSVASLFMLNGVNFKKAATFILLTVASLSIYQSIFFYAASLICVGITIDSVKGEISFKEAIKKIFIFSLLAVTSLIIDSFLSKLVAGHFGVQISGYLSAMIGWGKRDAISVATDLYSFVKDYAKGNAAYGLNSFSFSLAWLAILIACSVAKGKNFMLVALFGLATYISMFLLNIAIGSGMPPRAMTQAPMVFAGLFISIVVLMNLKLTPLIISMIFLVTGAASSTRLFYSDYMAREADKALSEQIISSIYRAYPEYSMANTPVFFYGSYSPYNQWRVPTADIFGASFFEWDGGNNQRMYRYLNVANIANLKIPDAAQVERSRAAGGGMPHWPSKGSVRMVDGVIIVKLSDKLSEYNR
ncbi:glucosyltransferase domain-containing protein [Pantoea septica]|uniref:glucosyltransferase domain-containing protein n=1 Tax=Pantoea septica TaxID=472695 RepID=UPI003CFC5CBE